MSDANAIVIALWIAAAAIILAPVPQHEMTGCVRIAAAIDVAGQCGRK